jgi:hypothetical protein
LESRSVAILAHLDGILHGIFSVHHARELSGFDEFGRFQIPQLVDVGRVKHAPARDAAQDARQERLSVDVEDERQDLENASAGGVDHAHLAGGHEHAVGSQILGGLVVEPLVRTGDVDNDIEAFGRVV